MESSGKQDTITFHARKVLSLNCASTAIRILIPEILDNVFENMDDPALAALAVVCKSWSDLALRSLWANSKNTQLLLALLRILAPMIKENALWVRL